MYFFIAVFDFNTFLSQFRLEINSDVLRPTWVRQQENYSVEKRGVITQRSGVLLGCTRFHCGGRVGVLGGAGGNMLGGVEID